MNFLTGIMATPMFLAIFLFEVWMFYRGQERMNLAINRTNRKVVIACLVVSLVQMVSCFFWLGGFIASKTNGILSEAIEEDERGDCVGLVGAEALLSVFQCLFSIVTLQLSLTVKSIHKSVRGLSRGTGNNTTNWGVGDSDKYILHIFSVLISIYTIMVWSTSYNRRCPQGTDFMIWFQHIFYPVYPVIDTLVSLYTLYLVRDIIARGSGGMPVPVKTEAATDDVENPVVMGKKKGSSVSPASGTENRLTKLVLFFEFQTKLTIYSGILGVGMFLLQYTARIEIFSVIFCFFCVTMYCTYAARRVHIIANYVRFDWKTRTFESVSGGNKYSEMTATSASSPGVSKKAKSTIIEVKSRS